MFWTSSAIGGHRRQVGSNDGAHAAAFRSGQDFRRGGLSLAQRFLNTFKRDRQADRAAMAETDCRADRTFASGFWSRCQSKWTGSRSRRWILTAGRPTVFFPISLWIGVEKGPR